MTEHVRIPVVGATGSDEPLMRELIGTVLRRARVEQGHTLRELAEAAQISLPYLSEIERGRKEPSSEVLAAVYRALGLNLADLLKNLNDELVLGRDTVPPRAPAAPAPRQQTMLLAA